MTRAVHQLVASLVPHDAVSMHALQVRSLLRALGFESEIFVKETRDEMASESRFYRSLEGGPGTVLLYQAATGSAVADYLVARAEPLIVNYHNLTPPRFFAPWEPHAAVELEVGRRQMEDLAERAVFGIAVSRFNEADLQSMGFRRTAVAPLLLDPVALHHRPEPATLERLMADKLAGGPVFLFVGRLAPNKAQHDVIKAFAAYRRLYHPEARLHLVGAATSPRYQRALRGFVAALDLEAAVDFAGDVTDAELTAYYRSADVFLCLSEHEGFCMPLLEAMHENVPVVAFAAGAIPETVADAAVVLPEKDPASVAAALDRVVTDADLQQRLIAAGRRRVGDFSLEASQARFSVVLQEALTAVAAFGAPAC